MVKHTDQPTPRIGLSLAQANFLDGIRISLAIARVAQVRLKEDLTAFSAAFVGGDRSPVTSVLPPLGAAWQIIDCVDRVRQLTQQFPGLKKRSAPWASAFLAATNVTKSFRNVIQHLESDIPTIDVPHERAWGVLEWLYVATSSPDIKSFTFVSGRVGGGVYGITAQLSSAPPEGISRVRLLARGKIADIDELVLALDGVSTGFESALESSLPEATRIPVDVIFHVKAWVGARATDDTPAGGGGESI